MHQAGGLRPSCSSAGHTPAPEKTRRRSGLEAGDWGGIATTLAACAAGRFGAMVEVGAESKWTAATSLAQSAQDSHESCYASGQVRRATVCTVCHLLPGLCQSGTLDSTGDRPSTKKCWPTCQYHVGNTCTHYVYTAGRPCSLLHKSKAVNSST